MRNLSSEDKAAELIVGLDLPQLDRHIKCSQTVLSLPLKNHMTVQISNMHTRAQMKPMTSLAATV